VKTHILAALIGAIVAATAIESWPESPEREPAAIHLASPERDRGMIHKPYARHETECL
jgi:hypothetical protein